MGSFIILPIMDSILQMTHKEKVPKIRVLDFYVRIERHSLVILGSYLVW
jgi:hypothetical protein